MLENLTYEIILVDDGSKDDTLKIAKKLKSEDDNIKIIKFSRNFGKESAILAGLRANKARALILLDADLQDPINLISKMMEIYLLGEAKIIYAKRNTRSLKAQKRNFLWGGGETLRSLLSNFFYFLINLLSPIKIESGVRDFRLMDKRVVECICEMGEYHRFSKMLFAFVGFKKEILSFEYEKGVDRSSKWGFIKLFSYGLDAITSFSAMPLKITFVIGLITTIISFLFGAFHLFDALFFGNPVRGYPSLIIVISFFGGMQMMFLGILGEYIGKIYEQVKNRPSYFIDDIKKDS